ncbi:unnamed protein product [Pleuronectes platessa]|uniref:Uncharacterized protein n=1 Tax=Pleuronectes platessa TaxID=8262 RepID=A0A9N7TV21_PLEPL|nr:unnamed protein product [Pleuronectes platessa]
MAPRMGSVQPTTLSDLSPLKVRGSRLSHKDVTIVQHSGGRSAPSLASSARTHTHHTQTKKELFFGTLHESSGQGHRSPVASGLHDNSQGSPQDWELESHSPFLTHTNTDADGARRGGLAVWRAALTGTQCFPSPRFEQGETAEREIWEVCA